MVSFQEKVKRLKVVGENEKNKTKQNNDNNNRGWNSLE